METELPLHTEAGGTLAQEVFGCACSRLHTPEKSILASVPIVTLPLDDAENLLCCITKEALCLKKVTRGEFGLEKMNYD